MKNLSKTCWTGRTESIRAVWVSYEILIETLIDIKSCEDGDRDARRTAINLLDRIKSFEFYLSMLFMKSIMYKTNIIVLEVQEIDQDILPSLEVMRQTQDAMVRIREDNVGLEGIVAAAADKCKSYGIDVEYEFSKKHRSRKLPKRIDENTGNATTLLFNQHYKREMFKVVDRLVSDIDDINEYFSNIVLPVTVLLPNKISKCTKQQVNNLCATFPNDLKDSDGLSAEIEMVGNYIEKSGARNLREAAKCLHGKRHFYPSLAKAYQLALTIPESVVSNERSFSKLRLIKNYLRSTVKEDRLDGLMILSCASDILDSLDLDKIADSWFICKTRKIKI